MITFINSFSPNMLLQHRAYLEWTPISLREIQNAMDQEGFSSHMGQSNVANIFSVMTGHTVRVNRKPYHLHRNDTIIQVQYVGPYFDDQDLDLPENGKLVYWKIRPMELKSSFKVNSTEIFTLSNGE